MFDINNFLMFAAINDAEQEEQEKNIRLEEERHREEEEMQREMAECEQEKNMSGRLKDIPTVSEASGGNDADIPPMQPLFSDSHVIAAQEAADRRASAHQAAREQHKVSDTL